LTTAAIPAYFTALGRPRRAAAGGVDYRALSRSNGRATIFHNDGDNQAVARILEVALEHVKGMHLVCWCLKPNHWHLVLWPREDGERSRPGRPLRRNRVCFR
jgi:putative transposase